MTREEAIDWLCRLRADLNNGVIFTPWNKEFTEALNDALDQEPKKGQWLDTGWIYECSCCHERSFPFDPSGYGSIYHNYCPNCGSDNRW